MGDRLKIIKECLENNKSINVCELPIVLYEGDKIIKGEDGKYYLETYRYREINVNDNIK